MQRPAIIDGMLERTATRFLRRIHRITHRMPVKLRTLEKRRVLVVAPHPDDEVIAVGGSLALHQRLESEVLTIYVSQDPPPDTGIRIGEAGEAARLLGFEYRFLGFPTGKVSLHEPAVSRMIGDVIREFRPEVLFCPFPGDHHRDHQSTSVCTAAAITNAEYKGEVWCYELWSCLWPNTIVDISSAIDTKRKAINCYASQVEYVEYVEAALGLNRYRGLKVGVGYGEALFVSNAQTFICTCDALKLI